MLGIDRRSVMLRRKQREGTEVGKMGGKIEMSWKGRGEAKQKESWTRSE